MIRSKGESETREEKERRWFVRDAEKYLSHLRRALLREDWETARESCGVLSDLIDDTERQRGAKS